MAPRGRPKKIAGKPHEVFVNVSKDEFLGLLRLVAKRFDETESEPTKQDLMREALRDLLFREGLLPREAQPSVQPSIPSGKRIQ
jgi:transposase